ncbi:hypothetical protein, partial [Gluconobacter cerinus]|uniref:hypothetical protein n=1 Tax=Gluconobacter cerinus TaxID=38307 RepID=UPI001B8CCD68
SRNQGHGNPKNHISAKVVLDHVDKRPDPEPCGGDIEKTHEGPGGLVVADCDAAHLLEVEGSKNR